MAGRYIPPHLRARDLETTNVGDSSNNKNNASGTGYADPGLRGSARPSNQRIAHGTHPDKDLFSLKEIEHHFWPDQDHQTAKGDQKTLHDSAANPGVLSYVLLFKDANPSWKTDGIIFTKSSLDLLPAESVDRPDGTPRLNGSAAPTDNDTSASTSIVTSALDGTTKLFEEEQESEKIKEGNVNPQSYTDTTKPQSHKTLQPIAIFSQVRHAPIPELSRRVFTFSGYHRITRLQFLQPRSPELVRMLEQKWTLTNARTGRVRQRERDPKSWEKSLKLRWAVVKFERDEEADKERGKPRIERLEDEEEEGGVDGGTGGKEKKGVNELLRELRMKDADADAEDEMKKEADNKVEEHPMSRGQPRKQELE